MIPINLAIGVFVFLIGMTLVASIAVNLYTQRLLTLCKDILGFAYFMAARDDEQRTLRRLDEEESGHD